MLPNLSASLSPLHLWPLLKNTPPLATGVSLGRKRRHNTSIHGSAMCRNGHTEKETLRTAPGEAYSAGPRPARLAHLNRDGVTRLQHRRKIKSILIRNTVVPMPLPRL